MFKIILLFTVTLLSGCASQSISYTPESLKGKGLLIGHISTSDRGRRISSGDWKLVINGEKYGGMSHQGYIGLPLPPGKYELEQLFKYTAASMGTVSRSSTSNLPIKAKFTIRKGEITNLGEVFLYTRKKGDNRYNIIFMDNKNDMKSYMKTIDKNLVAKFKNKRMHKADMKYVKKKDVNKIKRMAVSQTNQYNQYVMAGSLGSLAITKRNKKGAIKSIGFVKTNTFNRPHSCTFGKRKTACIVPYLSGNDKMFLADKTKYRFFKKPAQFTGGEAIMLKDNSIMWMNYDFTFYKTKDFGKTWKANTKYKKNVEMSFWDELGGNYKTPNIYEGKNGFYITAVSDLDSILHVNYKTGNVTKTSVPVKGDGIGEMVETAKGLYVRTDSRYIFSDTEIYFKAFNKSKWKKSTVPKSLCWRLKVKNYNAGSITVSCRDKMKFQTTNLADSWQKIN